MHTSPITALTTMADGRLVSGGYDGSVVCWSPQLEVLWKTDLPDLINAVHVAPDDQARVYVAVADGYAYAIGTDHGFICAKYGPHLDDVNYVCRHPHHEQLITVADAKDCVARVWNARTGEQERTLASHPGGTFSLQFSPNGRLYATTGGDGNIRIWSFDNGLEVQCLSGESVAEVVTWSPSDGECLLSGHTDGSIAQWNAISGICVRSRRVANSTIRCLCLDHSGRFLVVGGYDGHLDLLDQADWSLLQTLVSPFQWERAAAPSASGIYVGSFGSKPVLHSQHVRGSLAYGGEPTFGINAIAEDEKGRTFVVGDSGQLLRIDAEGRVSKLLQLPTSVNALCLCRGEWLAAADYRGAITVVNAETGEIVAQQALGRGPINCMTYHASREQLVSGGYDGYVRLWSMDLHEQVAINAHAHPVKSVRHVPGSDLLLTGASNGELAFVSPGGTVRRIEISGAEVLNDIAVDHQRARFATASRDCRVRVWSTADGSLIATLPKVHTKSIKSIDVNVDTGTIISGSYDGSVILWKESGSDWQWKRICEAVRPGVSCVRARGANGFAAGGWDGTLRTWTRDGLPLKALAIGSELKRRNAVDSASASPAFR